MTQKPINFITGNLNKLKWTKRYVTLPLAHTELHLTEIQSLAIEEVVEHKVKEAFNIVKTPVIVEDTSLQFEALGQLPGTLIKWFLKELGNDGLCKLVTNTNRNATVTVLFAFYDGKNLQLCKGVRKGTISDSPRGTNGFGWNPIFIPEGYKKTFAEMTDDEIDATTPRRIAAEKLNSYLIAYEKSRN